jgi:hypothetical protein
MAYKTKAQLLSDITNIKSLQVSDGKIDAAELQQLLTDILDSVGGVSTPYTMTSNTYDCNNGDYQIRTLTSNGSLTITNAVIGKFYVLKKIGSYTLTLPGSEFSSSGSVAGTGMVWITFTYDGTGYSFNFSTYSAT